ncbi:hypothetical protein U5N28_03220 [Lysinibacillus telephonicus]|uniref:Lipoprotein n=1 Tax=Lysinibacillus telephonicus TaxID=1714840 RepID=A0A3S0JRT3_9BACI|nr:hypothetical protein [Lysinibacillus telephonicus]RTQ89705.1 hypothetical protein EKG35_16160 [Lysinibacillus telephonicus]
MKKLLLFLAFATFVFLVGCSNSNSQEDIEKQAVEEPSKTENPKNTDEASNTEQSEDTEPTSSTSSSNSEELSQAFTEYMNEIVLLAPEEERIIGLYDSVTGVNYVNDEMIYNTLLNDVIPSYRQFIIDLEAIMPKNQEIRELHEMYIEAANIQYNSFTLMISALEEQNVDTITEANQGLDEARRILRDWLYGIEDLSQKTGVSLE